MALDFSMQGTLAFEANLMCYLGYEKALYQISLVKGPTAISKLDVSAQIVDDVGEDIHNAEGDDNSLPGLNQGIAIGAVLAPVGCPS